jgi:hypothetical protein
VMPRTIRNGPPFRFSCLRSTCRSGACKPSPSPRRGHHIPLSGPGGEGRGEGGTLQRNRPYSPADPLCHPALDPALPHHDGLEKSRS